MFKKLVVTFGGTGLLPAMPGTFGSLAAAVVYGVAWYFLGERTWMLMAPLTLAAGAVGIALYPWARAHFGNNDPRSFVLDEAVGQWATLMFIPLSPHPLSYIAAGFFLFRAFDVAKPFPIGRIERLTGWAGVMLDDVAAAVGAGICLRALVWLMERGLGG